MSTDPETQMDSPDLVVTAASVSINRTGETEHGNRHGRRRVRMPRLAVLWLVTIALLSFFAPLLPLKDPQSSTQVIAGRPSWDQLFGTDQLSRDILSRLLFGGRISFTIAFLATTIALVVGTAFGLIAGYRKGPIDRVVTFLADVSLAFPPLVLLLTLVAIRGASAGTLVIGLAIIGIPAYMRIARANTLRFANRDFIGATRGFGASRSRIMARHLLPNVLPSVLTYAATAAATIMVVEASISFIGFGIQSPEPSWGTMIAGGKERIKTDPHILLVPSGVLFLTVMALNSLPRGRRRPMLDRRNASGSTSSPAGDAINDRASEVEIPVGA